MDAVQLAKLRELATDPLKAKNYLKQLSPEQIEQLYKAALPKLNKYISSIPTPKQAAFLNLTEREAFFGGAAGGGKSETILTAALQYVDRPDYDALILRRTYADLAKPNAIMDRALRWLKPWVDSGEVHWSDKLKKFTFPSGATLSFGYLQSAGDHYQYQGAEFQFIAFDEVTQFPEHQYLYLFSRLRRKKGSDCPLRMRCAGNPGGIGHEWVKLRFIIEGRKSGRVFVKSLLDDNPHLDREEYIQSLSELDPVTRAQLLKGDWDISLMGSMFKRGWFQIVQRAEVPHHSQLKLVRYWDLAATEPSTQNPDPDWTVGMLQARHKQTGDKYILDVVRFRKTPKGTEDEVKRTAKRDGQQVTQVIEQEPGSAGKSTVERYLRDVLRGFPARKHIPTESKSDRASAPSSHAEAGEYYIVEADWTNDCLNEFAQFPTEGVHDDQVDAFTGGYHELEASPSGMAAPATGLYGKRPKV